MTTKVSFIVPARNKQAHVGKCVRSVLAQTYSPIEMLFSVQPSDDGTLAVIRDCVAGYDGPNDVRVVECPEADYVSMAGLNEHLNWLSRQLTGDLVVMCSADDYNEPERVAETVKAFEKYNPSYVGTRVVYETPDGVSVGETAFYDRSSRFVSVAEAIKYMIGSSGSSAWPRDLWDKYGPLRGVESQDIILPVMALMERGLYFVDVPLHHHVLHADPANTGMEGQLRANPGDGPERMRLEELNAAHNTHNWTAVLRRLLETGHYNRLTREGYDMLVEKIVGSASNWALWREQLTLKRIEPRGMRA